jgi:hypothetical protein
MHKTRKLVLLVAAMSLLAGGLIWQLASPRRNAQAQNKGPVSLAPPLSVRATAFAKTPAARDLPAAKPVKLNPKDERNGGPQRLIKQIDNQGLPKELNQEEDKSNYDEAVYAPSKRDLESNPPLPPDLTFDGITNANNSAAFGFTVSPPDTNGDVGPNHYVQTVNLLMAVYDKSGAVLRSPFKMSTLFAGLGAPCSTDDDGDPIVLYDQFADRWMVSQFAFANISSPPYFQCVAVSQTGDPTGAYYAYAFQVPNNEFNDYPHFGVWPNAYYMTVNQFTNGSTFGGTGAYAFDRAKMLAGDPGATFIYFDLSADGGGMLPADADGANPPVGAPGLFMEFTAGEFGDPSDAMLLFEFSPNFTTPALSTFTARPESPIPVAAFNPTSPSGRSDIEQPGTSTGLDSISDRLMFRLQYRNFGTHESLVTNHTVNVGTGTTVATHRAGVRYYEFRRTGGNWFVNEQATFAPADTLNRWMGSAAMNGSGHLAVGYSVSDSTVFPSIRYAGRLPSDPPGGLAQGEANMFTGSGSQTGSNRWGDYSNLAVDPSDDCSFWYTTEYLASNSSNGWRTRIGKFRIANCGAPVPDFSLSASPSSQSVQQGNATSYTATVTPVNGYTGTVTFSVSGLPAGAGATFTPPSVTTSGSSTMNVTTSASTPTGTYSLVISGTDGTLTRTANVTLIVTAPPPPAPNAPSNLRVTSVANRRISLAWDDNSTNETGFKLERCTGATCTNFAQITQTGANVTTFTNTGLARRTTYRYRVRAFNATGNSAYSNIVNGTTN